MGSHLVLLDWSLIDRSGHAYEYDSNVMRAFSENGWNASIYVHRRSVIDKVAGEVAHPAFSIAPTEPVTRLRALRPFAKFWVHGTRSARELRAVIAETDGEDALYFIQHAEAYHLPGIARAFRGARGRLMLMLRATSLTGTGEVQRPSFRTLLYRMFLPNLSAVLGSRLLLVTDSTRLQSEYAGLAKRKISVVPIPNPVRLIPKERDRSGPTHVLMAGRMSFEKGIQYVPGLIKRARALGLPAVFHVHIYHHTSEAGLYDAVRAEIEALEGPDVVLVREPLSTDEYWAQTRAADVSLLLYDPARYRNQTSNLVLDALACGTFPVVSQGTWLADIVAEAGFGAAVSLGSDATPESSVCEVLLEGVPRDIPDEVGRLLNFHTAGSFCDKVISLLAGGA